MQKKWEVKEKNHQISLSLAANLNISPITAQLLINRGINNPEIAEQFLNPKLSNLHSPFLLKDLKKAVERIKEAIARKEKIMVYGDYDVDGITAVALLKNVLIKAGANTVSYIPNRLEEGYGLNKDAAHKAHAEGVKLLITVDCGISAYDEVNILKELGVDTIITDHHQIEEKIPSALAVIDPKREDDGYPYAELSGVGVAFKLAQALVGEFEQVQEELDLVCLGTVSDVVPLTGENRVLVKYGLAQLVKSKRPGIRALIETAGLAGKEISPAHIGYILGPRINATGRLGSPEMSLQLLLTSSQDEARTLAKGLEVENKGRRKIESETLKEAIRKVENKVNFKNERVIVLSQEGWHPGVIGIVASRLVDRFHRPTVLITTKADTGRGSGRSIKRFHLFEAVTKCREFLEKFGGHECAVGLKLKKEKIAEFRHRLNEIAFSVLSPEDLLPAVEIDLELPLFEITGKVIAEIERFAPFGIENPRPVFLSQGLSLKSLPVTLGRGTVKFWVTDGKVTYAALGFNMANNHSFLDELRQKMNKTIDLVYSPSINCWQGIESTELRIKDLR